MIGLLIKLAEITRPNYAIAEVIARKEFADGSAVRLVTCKEGGYGIGVTSNGDVTVFGGMDRENASVVYRRIVDNGSAALKISVTTAAVLAVAMQKQPQCVTYGGVPAPLPIPVGREYHRN